MSKVQLLHKPVTLDDAVREIHKKFADAIDADKKGYRSRIVCGQMLIALRKRIEAGEAGEGVEWWPWYLSKFVRSRRDAEKVMALARADDPDAAAEDERAEAREGMRRHRAAELVAGETAANVSRNTEVNDPPRQSEPDCETMQRLAHGLKQWVVDTSEREEGEDIVDHAFRLVVVMDAEQQQRFIAKFKEYFKW